MAIITDKRIQDIVNAAAAASFFRYNEAPFAGEYQAKFDTLVEELKKEVADVEEKAAMYDGLCK